MGEVIRRTRNGKFLGYYLRWYERGRRRQRASHQPTLSEARRMLVEIEARVARGMVGVPERSVEIPSVGVLIERFLSEYSRPLIRNPQKYQAQARVNLSRVTASIGRLRADAVTASDVAKLRDGLLKRYANNSVRQTLSQLGTMYSWATRQGLVTANPARGIERPTRHDEVEYWSSDEVHALLRVAEERTQGGELEAQLSHARVLLAVHTGLRKGELCGLRWQDLDLGSGRLIIARSYAALPKSGKARHLRLPEACMAALIKWRSVCPATKDGLVFPVRKRNRTWGMASDSSDMLGLPALVEAAGCRVLRRTWHALRHTFASHFVMAGGNLLTLAKILGHSDVKITAIYAHLAPDFIGAEMNRVKF